MTQYEQDGKKYIVSYDLDNRITTAKVGGSTVTYRYDALGRRVIRKQGATKSALIWWGNSECAEHKHEAGQTVIQNDIMSHPTRLNSVIARAVKGSKYKLSWYHKNYLDHVYAVSNKKGDLIEHYRYSAFGEAQIYDRTGAAKAKSKINNQIMWNTRRLDPVTGYYLYKYRHYSPELGRWPSRDPLGEMLETLPLEKGAKYYLTETSAVELSELRDKGFGNLYSFLKNNSIDDFDIFGLKGAGVKRPTCRIISGRTKSRCTSHKRGKVGTVWGFTVYKGYCARAICFHRCRCSADTCFCRKHWTRCPGKGLNHGMEYGPTVAFGTLVKPARCTPGAAFALTKTCRASGKCCN